MGRRKKQHPQYRPDWNPNPHGRYPLTSQVKLFCEKTYDYYAESSAKERSRKIALIARRMVELGAEKNVLRWNKEDIMRWRADMEKGLDNATKRKYWRILRDFLDFYGIRIVEDMILRKEIRIPRVPQKEITTLDEETIWKIHKSTHDMPGWEGRIARFLTIFYPFTGLRPSELRTLQYADLNIGDWTLKVSSPKGKDLYGIRRTVGIPTMVRKEVLRFLIARKEYLDSHGMDEQFQWLIPYYARKRLSVWPEGKWNEIKRRINAHSGIRFRWKDYRSSFCQLAIDKGAELQAVSKVMGHKTTATTESYYGRIKDMDAINEIEKVFSDGVKDG